ncbi:hypothetical protein J0W91_19360, partial [Clostridioides difficile]|nr:hypothetical protein [Clostridioides difficile]
DAFSPQDSSRRCSSMHERWLWVMSEKQRNREYVRDKEMVFILLKTIPYLHLTDTVVMSLSTLPIQPQREVFGETERVSA